jgi:hypothetical protein
VTSADPLIDCTINKTSLDVVRCLINNLGADVNRGNFDGTTALFMAAGMGKLDVVRCLLKLRANVNQVVSNGATPLVAASTHKHEEVVKWLVKAGANTQTTYPNSTETALATSRTSGASASLIAYLEAKTHCSNTVQRCGAKEVPSVQAGAVLWGAVPAGALESAQGGLQAAER